MKQRLFVPIHHIQKGTLSPTFATYTCEAASNPGTQKRADTECLVLLLKGPEGRIEAL